MSVDHGEISVNGAGNIMSSKKFSNGLYTNSLKETNFPKERDVKPAPSA